MAEAAEIPEAKDPFERQIALSIAILAVVLSVVTLVGDNAGQDALLHATKASNQWAYYQSKSIKEHSYALQRDMLAMMTGSGVDTASKAELSSKLEREVARYEKEKDEIKAAAEEHEKAVVASGKVDDRCDLAGLLLQVAIVLCSVAILVRWRLLWYTGLAAGLAGTILGLTALF